MVKLIINGLMNDKDITWKKIACCCDKSNLEKCHPISRECKHCCCKQAEDSMPRKPFKVIQSEIKEGKITGKSVTKEQLEKYTKSDESLLVVFGSPEKGVHEIIGGRMNKVQNSKSLNFFPNQATETVRLEEALLGTLAIINAQKNS